MSRNTKLFLLLAILFSNICASGAETVDEKLNGLWTIPFKTSKCRGSLMIDFKAKTHEFQIVESFDLDSVKNVAFKRFYGEWTVNGKDLKLIGKNVYGMTWNAKIAEKLEQNSEYRHAASAMLSRLDSIAPSLSSLKLGRDMKIISVSARKLTFGAVSKASAITMKRLNSYPEAGMLDMSKLPEEAISETGRPAMFETNDNDSVSVEYIRGSGYPFGSDDDNSHFSKIEVQSDSPLDDKELARLIKFLNADEAEESDEANCLKDEEIADDTSSAVFGTPRQAEVVKMEYTGTIGEINVDMELTFDFKAKTIIGQCTDLSGLSVPIDLKGEVVEATINGDDISFRANIHDLDSDGEACGTLKVKGAMTSFSGEMTGQYKDSDGKTSAVKLSGYVSVF